MSSTMRVTALRKRDAKSGLVRVEVKVYASQAKLIKAYAERLRKQKGSYDESI